MFQLVAVQEIEAAEPVKADEDLDGFAGLQEHGVLPAPLPGKDLVAPAAPRLHLEGGAVHVHRMGGVAVGLEAPPLGLPEGNLEIDPVEVVDLAVDLAHPVK